MVDGEITRMHCRKIPAASVRVDDFSVQKHKLITINDFLPEPGQAIEMACLQKFAKITPQYPGVRAPLHHAIADTWLDELSPILSQVFHTPVGRWSMQGWYSIVTKRPGDLAPIQRLPHVDGTDPDQIALMLYLHATDHGGTAFFRHTATGLESLTDETFPVYKAQLEKDVATHGMPPRAYVTDGAPYFDRTHVAEGRFNQAVLYRGNLFHSGVIDNDALLPADPRSGRLTINAFLRPPKSD